MQTLNALTPSFERLLTSISRDDGANDANGTNRPAGGHKLGPKANQGAINAGLRALDRSGKPCRKWARGGFHLKSFTGVSWEIPRWTAPPKKIAEPGNDDSADASAADISAADNSSAKENKVNGVAVNSVSNSNSGADVEVRSSPGIATNSPAPTPAPVGVAVAAAS